MKESKIYRSMTFWIIFAAVFIAVSVFAWRYIFVPVNVRIDADPDFLYPDGKSTVQISLCRLNRLGWIIPFSRPSMRCRFEEGEDLVSVSYNNDSTIVTLKAKYTPGIVALIVTSEASMFPLYVRIQIVVPTALRLLRRIGFSRLIQSITWICRYLPETI